MFSSKRRVATPRSSMTVDSSLSSDLPSPNRRGGRMLPSIISGDLIITGNLLSGGELQVDGTIDGDVRASSLVIGELATVTGEIMAEEIIIHGRVIGCVRGLRVVLAANCHVEGEIFHESLAVEPGAFFEGNCRRSEDPLSRDDLDQITQKNLVERPQISSRIGNTGIHGNNAGKTNAPEQTPSDDQYADFELSEETPLTVKDGRVVVRRSASE